MDNLLRPPEVLIVDDSKTSRASLRLALESESSIQVVAEASDGQEARAAIRHYAPKLITMDLYLHREDGLALTAEIMNESPRPIILVTAADTNEPSLLFRAIRLGALDVFPKLPSPMDPSYEAQKRKLIRLVRALAVVPVVRRYSVPPNRLNVEERLSTRPSSRPAKNAVVAIGASTGGPPVLEKILSALPRSFDLPIAIAQHMSVGFTSGLADWLSKTSRRDVEVVKRTVDLRAGRIYLAHDDTHLVFSSTRTVTISNDPPRTFSRPSVDVLFESAARYFGNSAIGIILTGMGHDGKEGLMALERCGATTIAQEPQSCVVDSMPRHAIEAKAARYILDPSAIVTLLQNTIENAKSTGAPY